MPCPISLNYFIFNSIKKYFKRNFFWWLTNGPSCNFFGLVSEKNFVFTNCKLYNIDFGLVSLKHFIYKHLFNLNFKSLKISVSFKLMSTFCVWISTQLWLKSLVTGQVPFTLKSDSLFKRYESYRMTLSHQAAFVNNLFFQQQENIQYVVFLKCRPLSRHYWFL